MPSLVEFGQMVLKKKVKEVYRQMDGERDNRR